MPTATSGDLARCGFVQFADRFSTPAEAWRHADAVMAAIETDIADLEVIGNFVVPPVDGPPSREFQTLHFDFGVPLLPVHPWDVARFTALHIPSDSPPSGAVTRLLPLRGLIRGTDWPDRVEVLHRFATYGHTHGAWDTSRGYVEGSLARIVEAALGRPPELPSVPNDPGFLCGTEFATLADETQFFAERAIVIEETLIEVELRRGGLLIFDNFALAHGRRGVRQPGELHQRVFGHRALPVPKQRTIRDRLLDAFTG